MSDPGVLDPPVDPTRDHTVGAADAPAVLVVYGDYECPYSRRAHQSIRQVRGRLPDDRLLVAHRQFPLEKHPHARIASEAAEAAGLQGRFWEMHAALYDHQRALEPDDLRRYAADLGLDVDRFEAVLAAGRAAGRVDEDLDTGRRNGVGGTPTIFVNGRRYTGFYDPETLGDVLAEAADGMRP
jgi:protein-disulfide isomerase